MTFAHQGGWDELSFVLLPVVVFAVLLWSSNRRALQARRDEEARAAAGALEIDDEPTQG